MSARLGKPFTIAAVIGVLVAALATMPSAGAETSRWPGYQTIWTGKLPDISGNRMRIVVDRQGQATAAWEASSADGGRSLWTARRASTGTWIASEQVATFPTGSASFDLALDDSGTAALAWRDTTGESRIRATVRDRSGGWAPPVDLGSGSEPRFAQAEGGESVLVWETSESLVVRRLDPVTGNWTAFPSLALSPLSSEVSVTGDPDSGRGLVASWREGYTSGGTVRVARLGANGWATLGESSLVEGSTWARVGVDPTGRIIAGGERAYNTGEAGTLVTVGPDGVDNVLFELPGNDTTIVDMSPTGEIVAAWHEDRTVYTAEYVAGRWSSPRRAHSATLGSTSVYGMRIHSLTDGRWLVSWHQSSDSSAEEGTWTSLRGVDGTWREEYAGSTCFVADAVAAAPRGSLDIIGGCTDSVVGRRLDVEGPTARMLGSTLLPTYAPSVFATGLDHVGGVGAVSFEFASRSVSWSGGPWTGWSSIGSDTVHTDGISGIWHSSEKPGRTYCTRVRAVDSGGNVGEWSSNQTCYSAAIDDRQMRRSRGWREGRHDYWQHTFLTTSRKGATLRLPGVHARRFALLADATPGGGRVEVWFGGRLLKRVTLRSSTSSNEYRNVLLGVLPTARTATLVIRIVSKGKPVRIDGIHATPL